MIALCGVMLQYVWRAQEMLPVLRYVQYTALVSLGTAVLFALSGNASQRLKFLRHKLYWLIVGILVLAILSVPTSLRVGGSFTFITANFGKTVLMVGILIASVRDRLDIDRLVRVFVFGGAAYVVSAIAFAPAGAGRLGGGSYDPNDLGLFTVSTMPLCVYLMRRSAGWLDRLIGAGAAASLMLATVLSGSRGGFLALLAVAGHGLLGMKAIPASKRWGVMALSLVLLLATAGEGYWDRMKTILAPQEDYNWAERDESGRMEVWKRGLGYMMMRPVLGVGVNQFDVAEGTLSRQAEERALVNRGFRWTTAHNSYVQIGAELGIFGMALFVTLLAVAYRIAHRIGRASAMRDDRLLGQCFATLVVGYAVGCTFLSQAYSTYLYFALGMIVVLSRLAPRQLRTIPRTPHLAGPHPTRAPGHPGPMYPMLGNPLGRR